MSRVVTLLLLVALLSGCSAGSGEDGGVNPTLDPSAQPEDVVLGYFQALEGGDTDAAAAVNTYAFAQGSGWLMDPPGVTELEVFRAQPDVLVGPTQQEYDDAVLVPVSVTLTSAGDGAVDGPTQMQVVLWRGRVNDNWLIAGTCTLPPTDGRLGTPDDCPDRRFAGVSETPLR
jgi:hypothetical protein